MKILVIGTGLVGVALAKMLKHAHDVRIFGRNNHAEFEGLVRYGGTYDSDLSIRLEEFAPDAIIHAAGPAGEAACRANIQWAIEQHVMLSANLARWSRARGTHVVYCSSHLVYEAAPPQLGAVGEDAPRSASTLYGALKATGDALFDTVPHATVLRLPHLYDSQIHSNRDGVIERFVRACDAGTPLRINTAGAVDLLHVHDLSRLALRVIEEPKYGVYNVGGQFMTINLLGHVVRAAYERITGKVPPPMESFDGPWRPRVISQRVRDVFDWRLTIDLTYEMASIVKASR